MLFVKIIVHLFLHNKLIKQVIHLHGGFHIHIFTIIIKIQIIHFKYIHHMEIKQQMLEILNHLKHLEKIKYHL